MAMSSVFPAWITLIALLLLVAVVLWANQRAERGTPRDRAPAVWRAAPWRRFGLRPERADDVLARPRRGAGANARALDVRRAWHRRSSGALPDRDQRADVHPAEARRRLAD